MRIEIGEARPVFAPILVRIAEIEIGQGTGDGDLAHGERLAQRRAIGLKGGEGTPDFKALKAQS